MKRTVKRFSDARPIAAAVLADRPPLVPPGCMARPGEGHGAAGEKVDCTLSPE
jgi:hypothetical protein